MTFVKNDKARKFEYSQEKQTAYIEFFQPGSSKIYLTHTEVPEDLQGQGVGKALVDHTLSYIEQKELSLIPLCPFVKAYIKRNPAYYKLLDESVEF